MNPNCCRDSLPQITVGILENTSLTKETTENSYFVSSRLLRGGLCGVQQLPTNGKSRRSQHRGFIMIYPSAVWDFKLVTGLWLLLEICGTLEVH